MTATQLSLKEQFLTLNREERASLVRDLIETLDEESPPDSASIKAKWNAVIRRRIDEIDQGLVTCRPGEEFMKEMRERYP